jgi:integrase
MNSYQVRVFAISKRPDYKVRPWRVRWSVENKRFEESFRTRALADSFRAGLIKASNAGEPFDVETGRPVSVVRARNSTTFYVHARAYVAMKWPRAAARSRRGMVETMTTVTVLLCRPNRGRPDLVMLRAALSLYGLHPRRSGQEVPAEYVRALEWVEKASRPVVELESVAEVRKVLDGLAVKLDGSAAAAATVRRKRAVLYNALGYAVELGHLTSNPIDRVQWTTPEVSRAIDRRVVANPQQVAALLTAVGLLGNRAARLVAFFGCLYYAGMRPAEAADVRASDCELPAMGWGKVTLAETRAGAGRNWTDDGATHERRGLKHRARRETRSVPIPPALVALLRAHVEMFGLADDGRLFRGLHGGPLSESAYDRFWKLARKVGLTADQVASPLARRPYDLRHAAASLWLNAGVPPTEVARRLGHSVAVLLRVYVNCIDGGDEGSNGRIEGALS